MNTSVFEGEKDSRTRRTVYVSNSGIPFLNLFNDRTFVLLRRFCRDIKI